MTGETAGKSDIVSVQEAAHRLGISERTAWRRIRAGKLRAVEIGGRTCVQFAGSDNRQAVSDDAVSVTGNPAKNPTVTGVSDFLDLQEAISAPYREQVRRLEGENARLWQEVQAKQNTIDSLTRMLPPPLPTIADLESGASIPRGIFRRRGTWWIWLLILALAGVVGALWLWAFRPAAAVFGA